MKKRIIHIAPFIFLTFLLLPVLSAAVLQGTQWYLKVKAKDRMEKEQLVTITLPSAAVQWEKKGKELRVKGRLFDVKNFTVTGDAITATGYFDEAEATVESLLSFLPLSKDYCSLLQLLLVWQCLTVGISHVSFQTFTGSSKRLLHHYFFSLPYPYALVIKKPPRV